MCIANDQTPQVRRCWPPGSGGLLCMSGGYGDAATAGDQSRPAIEAPARGIGTRDCVNEGHPPPLPPGKMISYLYIDVDGPS